MCHLNSPLLAFVLAVFWEVGNVWVWGGGSGVPGKKQMGCGGREEEGVDVRWLVARAVDSGSTGHFEDKCSVVGMAIGGLGVLTSWSRKLVSGACCQVLYALVQDGKGVKVVNNGDVIGHWGSSI
jgi:hypothetical protein